MRKRLRKKLRNAEFTQFGFSVQYSVEHGLAAPVLDDLLDRFILDAVEANGLHCGGGGGPAEWDFFVCGNGRRSATDADRQRIEEWLQRQREVTARRVGGLQDAWHDDDEPSGTQRGSDAA